VAAGRKPAQATARIDGFLPFGIAVEASATIALPNVLALEIAGGSQASRCVLERDEADALAAHIAADLQALLPALAQTRLAIAGALFDAVELLRPGFPVWTTLDELARRAPREHLAGVVALGALAGRMPAQPLQPDPSHSHGPLRLLPIALLAPPELADRLATALETELLGHGEAGVASADALMRMLGVRLEHARYLSRNDLLALICVQYEHANLAPLWTLLEAALLTPWQTETTLSARGLSLHYADGAVRVESPTLWLERQAGDAAQRRHAFAGAIFELRQYAAVLGAHALPLHLQDGATLPGGWLEPLAEADATNPPPMLFAHEAPGLGIIAISVAQNDADGRPRLLAQAYPLDPQRLGDLRGALAARYDADAALHALGRIVLDERGRLGVPGTSLH
jgi:hypothetical protein